MITLHKLFRSKSTAILYQAMLSGKPIAMKDIPLAEGTVHRSKKLLSKLNLIKVVGRAKKSKDEKGWRKGGPASELWQLTLDGNTSIKKKRA